MLKGRIVTLEQVSGRDSEYIIKDSIGITAGRVFIIDLNKESRYCILRIKFYKENNNDMLKDALLVLLNTLFKTMNISKVNVIVDEYINTQPFVSLGFSMEGMLEDNVYSNGNYKSELVFGISERSFESFRVTNILKLEGRRIYLKLLTPGDTLDICEYYVRNKEHLQPFEPSREPDFYTLDMQKRILMEGYKQFLNGVSVNCGIYKDNKLIGKIQMSNIVYGVFRSAFIGYSIDEKEQGKGYAKEALDLMVEYSFNDLELHRIEASTLVDNIRSQKVLKGCGFQEAGLNKEYLFINGGWKDHITFYKINNG